MKAEQTASEQIPLKRVFFQRNWIQGGRGTGDGGVSRMTVAVEESL